MRTWKQYYAQLTQREGLLPELLMRKKQYTGRVELKFRLEAPLIQVFPYSQNDTDIIMLVAQL